VADSLPDISIGDFAESLLNSHAIPPLHESQAPSIPNVPGSENQLDISNVEVPDDFMDLFLGGKNTNSYLSTILEGEGNIEKVEEVPHKEKPVNQTERLSELLEQLTAVLSETKQLLSEMSVGTGTGSLGVGTGYSHPPKRKVKPKRNTRRRSVAETVASVLEELQGRNVR
jgi:hypothetical protein